MNRRGRLCKFAASDREFPVSRRHVSHFTETERISPIRQSADEVSCAEMDKADSSEESVDFF